MEALRGSVPGLALVRGQRRLGIHRYCVLSPLLTETAVLDSGPTQHSSASAQINSLSLQRPSLPRKPHPAVLGGQACVLEETPVDPP